MDVPWLIAIDAEDDSGKENAKESRRKKIGEPMRGIGQGKARQGKTIIDFYLIKTDKGGKLVARP